jgi:fructokinase
MAPDTTIVGVGEALFDLLPSGKALGGAPLNMACHAQQLLAQHRLRRAQSSRGRGVVASRVGTDPLGDEVVRQLAERGMSSEFVQRDAAHPTGTVHVELHEGQPTYDIVEDVAWDHFEWTAAWGELAGTCAAVCFGTLAQRSPDSREAIWRFLDAAPQAVRMLDVNLRQQYYDPAVLEESCRRATLVKLNEHELPVVAELLGIPVGTEDDEMAEIMKRFALEAIVLTRGKRGTLLVLRDEAVDAKPASYPAAKDADAVGAGDACSAGILVGWVHGLPPEQIGALANRLGAYVASQPGATPQLPREIVELVAP